MRREITHWVSSEKVAIRYTRWLSHRLGKYVTYTYEPNLIWDCAIYLVSVSA